MKIAKITWLYNGNYGTVLQSFALQLFLRDNGFDVVDIDYKASIKTKLLNWFKSKNSLTLFLIKFSNCYNKNLASKMFKKRTELFDEFKRKNMVFTQCCHTPEDLKELSKEYDIFICGSDQIWSPKLLNPVFFLNFVSNDKIRIAYAPSFGVADTTVGKKEQIAGYLKMFDHISVREMRGRDFIKELIGKDVPVLVDPTMLLNAQKWHKYIVTPTEERKYILCYMLTANQMYLDTIAQIAKKRQLSVIIIPTENCLFNNGFEEKNDVGPAEWLGYISNAELICTDSFHGCIFSALFNREFILFKRFSDSSKDSENSRIYTLMELFKTESRLIDEQNIASVDSLKEIDYEYINDIIRQKSEESGEWLISVLNSSML